MANNQPMKQCNKNDNLLACWNDCFQNTLEIPSDNEPKIAQIMFII